MGLTRNWLLNSNGRIFICEDDKTNQNTPGCFSVAGGVFSIKLAKILWSWEWSEFGLECLSQHGKPQHGFQSHTSKQNWALVSAFSHPSWPFSLGVQALLDKADFKMS